MENLKQGLNSQVEYVNPINFPNWNDLVLQNENYSIFNSKEWSQLLINTYGYTPYYLTMFNGNSLELMIPFMKVKSIFTGLRFVSLPFSDYCEPINKNELSFNDIINHIRSISQRENPLYIDIRSDAYLADDKKPYNEGFVHILNLDVDENILFANLRNSNKRNVKKAIRENVQIRFSKDFKSIKEFHKLNIITRKRHNIPPQPFEFFKNLYEILNEGNQFEIVEASINGKVIASCLFLLFGKKVLYKYGASDYAYQNLRANDLIFWEAIKHYQQLEFAELSFGRTEKQHESLRQFKLGWGVKEFEAPYYRYSFKRENLISDCDFNHLSRENIGINKFIFRKLPVPILKLIGTIAYRHIG